MISEKINYRIDKVKSLQGNESMILYLDPLTSENTFPFKDVLKKYGAKWDGKKNRWYWYLSNDEEKREKQMETMIIPCVNELNSLQDSGKPNVTADEEIKSIRELISKINEIINTEIETNEHFTQMDANTIKEKVKNFKNDLIKATTDEEFRKRFEPVIKQVMEGGQTYSILNTILIHIQDPQATYVYCLSDWNARNRYVFDKKHPIALFAPIQDSGEKNEVIKKYLKSIGKKNKNELTDDEQNELKVILGLTVKTKGWRLVPYFYDIRFTKVMRGKKDLVQGKSKEKMINTKDGNENGDLKWFDDSTPVTEESVKIYNAIVKSIEDTGIKLNFVNSLDGTARGVSKGGVIDILSSAPKNIGTCNTLIHEFSHEIFHHENLKNMNPKSWEKFYIGRNGGRNIVEQQAELCSWIVMRYLGYDMKTNINYLGNWGINEENAVEVFDQVANAADTIMGLISKNYNKTLNESMSFGQLTGLDVAKMIGPKMEQLYLKSKEKKEQQMVAEKDEINNLFEKYCGLSIN